MSRARSPVTAFPASMIIDADDMTAVIVSSGRACLSLSIAEARQLSLEIARAADEAELKLSQQKDPS
jgi:hypothetical protein